MSLIVFLLLLTPAHAGGGALSSIESDVTALRTGALPADPALAKDHLLDLLARLKRVNVAVTDLAEKDEARGRLRLGEAYLYAGRQFVDAPCPDSLDPEHCAV